MLRRSVANVTAECRIIICHPWYVDGKGSVRRAKHFILCRNKPKNIRRPVICKALQGVPATSVRLVAISEPAICFEQSIWVTARWVYVEGGIQLKQIRVVAFLYSSNRQQATATDNRQAHLKDKSITWTQSKQRQSSLIASSNTSQASSTASSIASRIASASNAV